MNTEIALFWVQEGLRVALMLVGPLLGVALVVGLCVSLFQAVTSIQEMTLSYIPKMLSVGLILFLLAPWMIEMLVDFMTGVITFIPNVSR